MYPALQLENLKESDHFDDLHVDGRKILKMNLTKIWWEGMD